MSDKTRFIIVCTLILLSAVSFSYCAFSYPKNNSYPAAFTCPDKQTASTSGTEQKKQASPKGKSRPRMGAT